MANFTMALQQFDCNFHSYSPLVSCTDCVHAYQEWVCATSIPRCYDENSSDPNTNANPNVIERTPNDLTLSNRGLPNISQSFMEQKPCIDLCWRVVQTCPSFLGFSCPDSSMCSFSYGSGNGCNGLSFENASTLECPPSVHQFLSIGISNHDQLYYFQEVVFFLFIVTLHFIHLQIL